LVLLLADMQTILCFARIILRINLPMTRRQHARHTQQSRATFMMPAAALTTDLNTLHNSQQNKGTRASAAARTCCAWRRAAVAQALLA
jgi:hypothetical protein